MALVFWIGVGVAIGLCAAAWWRWLDMNEDDTGAGDEGD